MKAKIRIARATNNLKQLSKMYEQGLGLDVLGSFENHSGFDGIMLGNVNCDYHFEFTQEEGQLASPSNSYENLIIFYLPDQNQWSNIRGQMLNAGFQLVTSHNPYWDLHGCTFEDPEKYRIVLCNKAWQS